MTESHDQTPETVEVPEAAADADQADAAAPGSQAEADGTWSEGASDTHGLGHVQTGLGTEVDESGVPDLQSKLDELTGDLQRLQAEYVNYKRRVDRDRELTAQNATFKVLSPIIEVLDTIDRAREHGEVEGGFKAVADQLERIVSGLGLTRFGEPGDEFDPQVHEALSHLGTDPDVKVTTVKVIAKAGYRIGDRVVRAAQVLVVDPGE